MNRHQFELNGRPITVTVTRRADEALSHREAPLHAEMELYFSCLIRKRVLFREARGDSLLDDRLSIGFRPVMTAHCGLDYEGDEPPLTDFPIVTGERYTPHWLTIDYHNGEFIGEFGYSS